MEVGKYTYGLNYAKILSDGEANLKVGKFCSIASNVKFVLGGNHRVDRLTTYPFGHIFQDRFNKFNGEGHPKTNGDIIVGNDVWIGLNATIMSGVHIGDGAVIAMNAHVVQSVEPYSVVGGNPATLYYYRFNEDAINKLLKLKWWDLEDAKINELTPYLCSNDYEKLFEYCEQKLNIIL